MSLFETALRLASSPTPRAPRARPQDSNETDAPETENAAEGALAEVEEEALFETALAEVVAEAEGNPAPGGGEGPDLFQPNYPIPGPVGRTLEAIGGVDLRDVRLESGQTAYDRYQELAAETVFEGKNMEQALAAFIADPRYADAPDDPKELKGSRRYGLARIVNKRRRAAMLLLKAGSEELQKLIAEAKGRERRARAPEVRTGEGQEGEDIATQARKAFGAMLSS